MAAPKVNLDKAKAEFEKQVGIPCKELENVEHSFPAAWEIRFDTGTRTFWGRLNAQGQVKPNSIKEERY